LLFHFFTKVYIRTIETILIYNIYWHDLEN
jgi:hypothetical protein